MNTNARTCFQYCLALPNNGNATVRVEQKVNGIYQYLTAQQTQTTSGIFELTFASSNENIRISVSGTSGFALQQISLERDNVDTLVNRYLVSRGYRYGFQNQEKDDEVKGSGNSVNYTYRMHDPRFGRFFAVDPLASEYPHNSTYAFSENRVLDGVELEGLEKIHYKVKMDDGTWGAAMINGKEWIDVVSDLDENVNCYIYGWPNGSGVMKAVYKSINQGGTASYELLKAHYDHDHSQTINAVEMSRAAAGSTPWYRKGILGDWEGNDDGANTGNNAAGEQAPWPVKVIAGLNPLVSIPNAVSVLTTDTDIYGVEASTKTDKVLAVLSIFGELGGFTKTATILNASDKAIKTAKVADATNTVVQGVNDAGALDEFK